MPGLYGNVGNTTVSGGNTTSLYSTNTSVSVSNNLNVNDINASGNLFVAGTGTFGGNVTAPNFIGNLTGNVTGNISGNVVAPGSNTQVIYNDSGVLGGDADFTWNENTNVLSVNGNITATGNVSGNYILGNGSQLTGLPATYGNANVSNFLANGFGSNTIVTTGNVTAGFFIGNGSQLTGIVSSYGNANVAAFLPTYTGNLAGGNLAVANNANINGNLTVGGTIFGTFSGNITGNIVVPGANTNVLFNNSGNAGASADFTFNDATNVMTVNGTANVGVLNATGDITGQALYTTTGLIRNTSGSINLQPAAGSNVVINGNPGPANLQVTGDISATGNVTGANIIGNGQFLTNLPGANVTGTVANAAYATNAGAATTATSATTAVTVTGAAQANITSLGTLTGLTVGGDQNITGNLIVGQNLTVNGNTIQVNITELNVQDPIIGLGRGENNAPLTSNDGKDRGEQLWYYTTSEKSAFTGYDNSTGNLVLATDVTIANEIVTVNAYGTTEVGDLYAQGNITGDYVFGNAAFMTGIPAQYGNANVADFLDSFGSNAIVTTGNITAGYFFGDGSGLTNINAGNIVGSYGNANVSNFLANGFGSNTITTTGNIQTTTFKGTNFQATGSGGGALKNTSGTTQASWGGGGGDNFTVSVSTNINGANAQVDISPTGTGHVHIKPTGTGAVEIAPTNPGSMNNMVIGNVTPLAANFTTVGVTGNVSTGNVSGTTGTFTIIGGTLSTAAQPNITSVGTLTSLTASGNITGGNLNTAGRVVATGTVTAGAVTYANTDGTAGQFLTTYGNGITYWSTGGGGGSYGNANVANFLANGFGSNTIVTTGNITAANLNATTAVVVSGSAGNITGANYITGNFFVGNGSQLTGIVSILQGNLTGNIAANGYFINGLTALTTSGNVTANYFQGNGSQLTGVATLSFTTVNANGTSIVADSTSDTLTINAGSGVTILGNATTDTITISTNGQANALSANLDVGNFEIYSSTAANVTINDGLIASRLTITGGSPGIVTTNLTASQAITATGNITSSGNIESTGNLIASKGLFVTDGNTTLSKELFVAGNIWANSSQIQSGSLNVQGAGTFTGNVQAGNLRATGTVRSGAVTYTGSDGSAGQVLTTYGNGITYFSTVSGGSANSFSTIAANGTNIVAVTSSDTLTLTAGSGISITGNATTDTITITATGGSGGTPGGSDTQIQFNDGGAFAGNAQMTFSKTTGNVAFGNLIIQTTNPNNAAVITNLNTLDASARPLLERIAIGSGFNGDYGNTGDYLNTTRNSAVTVMNRWDVSSVSNTTPMIGQSSATWYNNTAGNVITSAGNARGMEINTFYTGANRWGTQGTTNTAVYNGFRTVALGGNGVSGGSVGTLVGASITAGTNSNNAVLGDNISILSNQGAFVSGGNNGNVYGLTFNMNSTNPTVGNTYLIHNQSSSAGTHASTWGIGGNFRSATRYFMLRNDDDVAQVKLGSLRTYHEFLGNATQSTSSITIGPRQGPGSQVVRTTPTEAITSVTFTGFITSASDGTNTDFQADSMTWIIQQGATPYAVTLPTGNAQIKYSGGVSTIGTTANAVTMCAITAYDNGGTTNYLVTVSPEFV